MKIVIQCAIGGNCFADCTITHYGDLVRISGIGDMDFDQDNALKLAVAVFNMAFGVDLRYGDFLDLIKKPV